MPDNINLIPSEVVRERSLKRTYSRFLVFSFIMLAVVFVGAGIVVFLQSSAQNNLNTVKNRINAKEDEIVSLGEVERKASALTAKLDYADKLINSKVLYSRVMKELKLKSKTGITVTDASISETYEVLITGVSTSTTTLQTYINDLVKEPDNLFSDAKILEVSIKEGSGLASFKVSVKVLKSDLLLSK